MLFVDVPKPLGAGVVSLNVGTVCIGLLPIEGLVGSVW